MLRSIRAWTRTNLYRVVDSIAFYPALMVLLYIGVAAGMIWFDLSGPGLKLKGHLGWLSLRDASAARAIISTIAGGIITLTVFSFSMVMIVLNQAASQLSNRLLDRMIGNRFQQLVLGAYIGTIVYALLLLSTIREHDTGSSVPALSTYLLILAAIVDIILFIYFLHFITQEVKYEVIIANIHSETLGSMEKDCSLPQPAVGTPLPEVPFAVAPATAGVYEDFDLEGLVRFCQRNDVCVEFTHLPGTFILAGAPLLTTDRPLGHELQHELLRHVPLAPTGTVEANYTYGFRQLTEIAMKALSPGINDPGTAMLSLRAIPAVHLPLGTSSKAPVPGSRRSHTDPRSGMELRPAFQRDHPCHLGLW
ncbi:MAG: DUF2254 domain-containing protein [Flavobacteriales bacterium]|nr:DUF2254 domain-containing protein [Flavobacteriales bacterium]